MTTATAPAFANRISYSDTEPCEVVRVVSDKCMEIRDMDATLRAEWKPNTKAGGFMGHTVNNGGEWDIVSNASNEIIRIRLQKNGQWKDASGNRYKMADAPRRFYDFNF